MNDNINYELLLQKLESLTQEMDRRMSSYEKSADFISEVRMSIEIIKVTVDSMQKSLNQFSIESSKKIDKIENDFNIEIEKINNRIDKLQLEPLQNLKQVKMAILTLLITTPIGLILGQLLSLIIK